MNFLTGLGVGIAGYWGWAILSEGILKKIQIKQGRFLLNKGNERVQALNERAKLTCTQIDDILLAPLAEITGELTKAIAGEDLDPVEAEIHRQLIAQNFKLELLLEKLGLDV